MKNRLLYALAMFVVLLASVGGSVALTDGGGDPPLCNPLTNPLCKP